MAAAIPGTVMNDAELLERYVCDRSEAAFAELVERHVGLVHATALAGVGGDAHLARDVSQKVFADLARKARSLRGHPSLGGWLHVAAHHAAAREVRGEQRRRWREQEAQALQQALETPGAEPDWTRLRPVLDEAVVALKASDREAVALRFFDRCSFAEMGRALHISEEAARKRLTRALDQVRRRLRRRGITSTATLLAYALGESGAGAAPAGLAAGLAGQALAQASSLGLAAAAAWLGSSGGLATLALSVGAFGVGYQHRINTRLEAAWSARPADRAEVAALDQDNRRLAQAVSELGDLRRTRDEWMAQAAAVTTEARTAPAPTPPATATVTAQVSIQAAGTLQWAGRPVTLDQLLQELRDLDGRAAASGTTVHIHNLSGFSQMAYVIDEVRKANIQHVVVESATMPATATKPTWF